MEIDSIVNLKINYLKKNGITEVGYTKKTCINYGVYSTIYLFWKSNNSTFIQKFKNSKYDKKPLQKFKAIKIIDSVFFDYYLTNKKKLNNEEVKHFKYKLDSIVGNNIYSGRIITNHSCLRYFVVKSNNENFYKQFDYFDLKEFDTKKVYASKRNYTKKEIKKWEERGFIGMKTKIIHENYPKRNINFDFNKELKLLEWDKIISEFIKNLESKNNLELIKN